MTCPNKDLPIGVPMNLTRCPNKLAMCPNVGIAVTV